MNSADVSLAISLEDLSLLNCSFQAEAPIVGRDLERRLLIRSPQKRFSLDVKRRKNVLHTMVDIQFGLFDVHEKVHVPELGAQALEVVHFGLTAGAVVTAPLMGDDAIAPRHLAGSEAPADHRDKSMERAMRLEAIKAAYGLATAKVLEMSSMSPAGSLVLPLIDYDEILDDISRKEG